MVENIKDSQSREEEKLRPGQRLEPSPKQSRWSCCLFLLWGATGNKEQRLFFLPLYFLLSLSSSTTTVEEKDFFFKESDHPSGKWEVPNLLLWIWLRKERNLSSVFSAPFDGDSKGLGAS